MYTKMKKVILSSLMLMAAVMMSAATYTWEKVVDVKLTDGNNDTYTSTFGAAAELTDAASWGAVPANLEGATVRAYTTLGGTNYEQLFLNSIENLPLTVKTYNSTSLTFELTALVGEIKLYDNGNLVLTVAKGGTETDTYECTVATGATIEGRFVINYVPAPTCTTVRNNLVVDRYYTICLPKAVTAANGASFWSMSNRGEGVAYLEEVQLPLVAGRPYIFQAEAEELCVELSGDDAAAGAAGALVGTFAAMDQAALDAAATAASSDIYLLYNNELWLANGQTGNNLPAYRAYVVYDELIPANPTPAPGRRVRAIPMHGQTATGVENLNASEAPAKAIIDGKLYIIRGEQMFDATGRLVK